MRKYLTTFATMKNINSDQLMFLPLSQSLDLPHFLLYLNGVLVSFLLFQHFFFQPLLSICMFLLQFYRIFMLIIWCFFVIPTFIFLSCHFFLSTECLSFFQTLILEFPLKYLLTFSPRLSSISFFIYLSIFCFSWLLIKKICIYYGGCWHFSVFLFIFLSLVDQKYLFSAFSYLFTTHTGPIQ